MPAVSSEESTVGASKVMRRVQSPRYATILAFILTSLFVVAALMLAFVPWQQTAYGTGELVAYAPLQRQQIVEAPFKGRVVQWYVKEGSLVDPGDPIAKVRDLDPRILERLDQKLEAASERLRAARERTQQLKSRLEDIRDARASGLSAARFKIGASRDRVEAARQKLEAARARVVTTERQLARKLKLGAQGLVSTREVDLAKLEQEQAKAALREAQAALSVAKQDVEAFVAERLKLQAEMDAKLGEAEASLESAKVKAAKMRAELTELQSNIARQDSQEVVAPRKGTILRLAATEGTEIVKGGDELAVLVPDPDTPAVELWMDGVDAPLLSEGQEARVQFEGWPALQIAGWPSLAIGTFRGRVQLIDAAANDKGRIRILVVPTTEDPWPASTFLRQGMLTRGWVLLGEVSVGWELWRQFNGFPPQLQDKSPFLKKPKVLKPRKPK